MKKTILSALFVLCGLSSALAGGNKVYETKISADPIVGSARFQDRMVFAGEKDLTVVQLSDGKTVLDKSYKDLGLQVTKATDAVLSSREIVVSNKKAVSCIDLGTGTVRWECTSFAELDAERSGALALCGDVVLVSDKKGKDNFTLSCLSMKDGHVVWSIEKEKNKILPRHIAFVSGLQTIGVYTAEKKSSLFRLVDLQNGTIHTSIPLEGAAVEIEGDPVNGLVFVHHLSNEDNAYLSAFSLKDTRFLWKTKTAYKSTHTPMTMNTDEIVYYSTIQCFDQKVMLKTEGIEVFDSSNGKSLYQIPFVPYYKWGVGHYTNGIFEPIVTENSIVVADRSAGDMYLKCYNRQNGQLIWSTDKLKKKESAPQAFVEGNQVIVQFGGLNYFEVVNNTGIGKLLDPFNISAFDLQSGKMNWTVDSKQDFYQITPINDQVLIVGTDKMQVISPTDGKIIQTDKNPFPEDYFMTKFTIGSYHKLQKAVDFDYLNRVVYRSEAGKFIKYTF